MSMFDDDDDVTPLNEKNSGDDFTQEEWDTVNQYEYGQEWLDRDEELRDISLDDYNEMKCVEDYGLTDEEMDSGDDD